MADRLWALTPPGVRTPLAAVVSSRTWPLLCVAICIAASLTASYKRGWSAHQVWTAYETKARAPLAPLVPLPGDEVHVSNLDLRVTVPLIARALGLQRRGLDLLYLACGVLTLFLAYTWMARRSGDRITASAFCLACAATSSGSQGLIGSPFYDPVGILLGVVCLWRLPVVVLLTAGVAAAFVDERAGLMLPAVLLAQWFARTTPEDRGLDWRSPVWPLLGVGVAIIVLTALGRWWLQAAFGLHPPSQGAFVGTAVLRQTVPFAQILTFSSIELLWVPVAVAVYTVSRQSRLNAALLALAILAPTAASFLVFDVLRSMAYALPAVILCCGFLAGRMPPAALRSLFLWVAVGNLLLWDYSFYGNLGIGVPAPLAWWWTR